MYVFAEPVTEERADEIQNTGTQYAKEWARRVVGVGKNDPEAQEEWQDLQEEVDEQVSKDGAPIKDTTTAEASQEVDSSAEQQAAAGDETITESERETETSDNDEGGESAIKSTKSEKDTT